MGRGGKTLYFLNKEKSSLTNRLNRTNEPMTSAERKDIEKIEKEIVNLRNKIDNTKDKIAKVNAEIAENMN